MIFSRIEGSAHWAFVASRILARPAGPTDRAFAACDLELKRVRLILLRSAKDWAGATISNRSARVSGQEFQLPSKSR